MKQAPRIIPVLGLLDGGLWKTQAFSTPRYVGDPINALRVFNEKEADEVLLMGFRQTLTSAELPKDLLSRSNRCQRQTPMLYTERHTAFGHGFDFCC